MSSLIVRLPPVVNLTSSLEVVIPAVPKTVSTVRLSASLYASVPSTSAASVPIVLAWVSVKVPVPRSRRSAALMIDPTASVTPAALRSTV